MQTAKYEDRKADSKAVNYLFDKSNGRQLVGR